MSRHTRDRSSIWASLGVSLLVHLNLVLLAVAVLSLNPDGCNPPRSNWDKFEVSLVPDDPQKDHKKDPALKKIEEQKKKEEQQDKDLKGQVVDLPRPREEQQPDKARYLSDYDSKVRKETKARATAFKAGRLIPRQPLPVPPRARPATPAERRRLQRKIMKLAMRTRPDIPRSKLPASKRGDLPAKVEQDKAPHGPVSPKSTPAGPKQKKLSLKDLKLNRQELARALGSRVNDYLKGVDQGKQTLLNSKRWRFATFFNRVKRQVAQNWHPDVVYKRRDPTGHVYGFKDRLTILRVRLTSDGKLKEVHLENASGVGFLDDEALAAFRAAGPFPNPPKGLVDRSTGVISFRFGFLFEISRRPSFKIFRGRH